MFAFKLVYIVSSLFIRARDRIEFIIGYPKKVLNYDSKGGPTSWNIGAAGRFHGL